MRLLHIIAAVLLTYCGFYVAAEPAKPALSHYALNFYSERLADGLFGQLQQQPLQQRITPQLAVTSFVPVTALSLQNADSEDVELANQLAESMLSAALQRGYTAYDFRLRNEILLQSDHEQVFSRQLTDLTGSSRVDTVLSGTYSVTEDAIVVNARIIDLTSKQVLAAVTDYIPVTVFWSEQQVMKRGKYLHRQSKGDGK